MNNKTREKKIEIIRGAVNSDDYIELLSDEQIDELCEASIVTPQLEIVDQFDTQSARGSKGFGSSDEVHP